MKLNRSQLLDIWNRMMSGRAVPRGLEPAAMAAGLKQMNPMRFEFEVMRMNGKAFDHNEHGTPI